MSALREAMERIRSFFQKPQRDSELDAEMAAHLELATEENVQQGMPADEARRLAMIRFGGVTQAKEQQREARGLPWLDVLMQDVRFTLRTLGRDRGFTLIAVIIPWRRAWGLAPTSPCSAWSIQSCCGRFRFPIRNSW